MNKKDLIVLKNLLLPRWPSKGSSHADYMEKFYGAQVEGYDDFRKRLLHGRSEMMQNIEWSKVKNWIDMGAGTGYSLELAPAKNIPRIELVDLSTTLLKAAWERAERLQLPQVQCIQADAVTYQPNFTPDLLTYHYSLDLIPDLVGTVENALKILPSGGIFAAADFYVSSKNAPPPLHQHGAFTRYFWPIWFSYDHLYLDRNTVEYLQEKFETLYLREFRGSIPYMPFGLKVPHFVFVGRKR